MNRKGILNNIVDNLAAFVLILLAAFLLVIPIQANNASQKIDYKLAMQDIQAQEHLNTFLRSEYAGKTIAQHIAEDNTDYVLEKAKKYFEIYGFQSGLVIERPNKTPAGFYPVIIGIYQSTITKARVYVPSNDGPITVNLLMSTENKKLSQEHQTIMEN